MKILLVAALVISALGVCMCAFPRHLLDPVDICILTCDYCFKSSGLASCANHCIQTGGFVDTLWKMRCPAFGEIEEFPSVQQV